MINSYDNINYIFAKPYKEYYYMYSINSIENLTVISKDDLRILIFQKLGCTDVNKLMFLLERNQSFIFDYKSKQIKKFKDISPDLTKKDLDKKFIQELHQNSNYHSSTSLSEKCRNLFGR